MRDKHVEEGCHGRRTDFQALGGQIGGGYVTPAFSRLDTGGPLAAQFDGLIDLQGRRAGGLVLGVLDQGRNFGVRAYAGLDDGPLDGLQFARGSGQRRVGRQGEIDRGGQAQRPDRLEFAGLWIRQEGCRVDVARRR